jgi:hypothetical protein
MDAKKLLFTGLLGAAFSLSGNQLLAQDAKPKVKYKFKTQTAPAASQEKQSKVFEKAAKLSAKASELAAAGKHQEAAEMAQKAAQLLSGVYQVNKTVKLSPDAPKVIGDVRFTPRVRIEQKEAEARAHEHAARLQAEHAHADARKAYENALEGHENHAILMENLHEHLGDLQGLEGLHKLKIENLDQLGDLKVLHNLEGLKQLEELQVLREIDFSEALSNEVIDLENILMFNQESGGDYFFEGDSNDVKIFKFKGGEGERADMWTTPLPGGKHDKAHGIWSTAPHAEHGDDNTFLFQGEGGNVQGEFKIELRLRGDANGMQWHGKGLPNEWIQKEDNHELRVLRIPGGSLPQGRYQLRSRNSQLPIAIGEDGSPIELKWVVENHANFQTDCEVQCEVECEADGQAECDSQIRVEFETHCEEAPGDAAPEKQVHIQHQSLPKAEKSSKQDARKLLEEMQREMNALRREITELRRTMGDDPLVLQYRQQAKQQLASSKN